MQNTNRTIAAASRKPSGESTVPRLRVRKRTTKKVHEINAQSVVFLGLDVHAKQITVVRQIDHTLPQPAQRFDQARLLAWIAKMTAQGATVFSCYEAGCFGYVLHRALAELGVENLVIAPETWCPRHKTDRRDARELCLRLERYHGGNTRAFSVVRVPTVEQERRREAGRQRQRLLNERMRSEKRGASLLLLAGIKVSHGWWKPLRWAELKPTLSDDLQTRVGFWQAQALLYDGKQQKAKRALEAEVQEKMESLPAGLGNLTWRLLCGEILTWKRFNNRRQVASYTGLCPSDNSSGESQKQGPINRCGNPRVRTLLVETAWRLTRYEKEWRGFKKFPELLDKTAGSRKRRRLIVAAARLLAIDLWRLETRQTEASNLGLSQAFSFRAAEENE